MPVLLAAVAGSATAGSLVVEFPASVATPHSYGTNGLLAIARKPLAARLDVSSSRAFGNSRFETRHSFPLGKRLRRSCLRASALQQTSTNSIKWVLDPVGDGNTSHLDAPVPLPSGFELASDAATIGRVKDRADVVIPVATVSGVHARLEKKKGVLYITDLDSTNGTFINNRRIRPGAVTPVAPGSHITFGDEHLAVFRFLQLEDSSPAETPTEESLEESVETPAEVVAEAPAPPQKEAQ
ncbi:uncharacterized protein [Physcomitrium patens]|uniref:FHA domain-containing protein n=1 Tax=Physcomitrium patens TaxID=3218 RepID=A9RV74_PHYPA|nr:uncharacterized protein LOC112276376 [Physcomitrium patens]PNR59933.1 hypothetical protein PHYPA_002725 [Physcomitrium patens]|eukprot:XP_024363411.1 uncharacterized protein LOC112276376 [Physcomitrella patens]